MEHNVANTILRQLGGINRLVAMTGAYNFIDRGNGVSFKIKNAKANYIKITLNGKDLYNLEIGRIRGTTYKVVLEQEDLYNDQLKPMIEKTTGMYLSFKEGGHLESDENGEMLKNQVTNILHHANELQKMLDGVKDVEPWVITKAQRSVTDLADITHYLEGESKKMADGGYMARGGIVQYVNEKDSWKLSRANTNNLPKDIFAKVENTVAHMQFAGNMLVAEGRKKYHEEYLYFLDDYDKDVTKNVKLKQDEKLFRYVSYTTAIGGMSPLVKINVSKALVYYPIYDEQDPDKIQFHTKGVRAEYINLIQDPRNYEEGGVVSESDFDSLKKGDKISITYSSGISRSNKVDLIVKSKTLVGKGKSWESEKITFVNAANPNGVNYYAYKRKGGKVSFAIGDMAIWGVKISNEMADGGYMAKGGMNGKGKWVRNQDDNGWYYYIADAPKVKTPYSISIHEDIDIGDKKVMGYSVQRGGTNEMGYVKNYAIKKFKTLSEAENYAHKWMKEVGGSYAEGGMMAKGGSTNSSKYQITTKPDSDGFYYIVERETNEKIKIPSNIGYGKIENKFVKTRKTYGGKDLKLQDAMHIISILNNKMAMGGETFEDKVKSIKSSLLSRKKVSPSVQKDYGKTYSPKEAEESAKRIVGAMTARERMKTKMRSKKSK